MGYSVCEGGSKQHSLRPTTNHHDTASESSAKSCESCDRVAMSGVKVESEAHWASEVHESGGFFVETVGLACSGRCSYDSQLGWLQLTAPLFRAVWRNHRRTPAGNGGGGEHVGLVLPYIFKRYRFVRDLECTISSFTRYVSAPPQNLRNSWRTITP